MKLRIVAASRRIGYIECPEHLAPTMTASGWAYPDRVAFDTWVTEAGGCVPDPEIRSVMAFDEYGRVLVDKSL